MESITNIKYYFQTTQNQYNIFTMKKQNEKPKTATETRQEIIDLYDQKGFLVIHLNYHFYLVGYEGKIKIIKIGKPVQDWSKFAAKISRLGITTETAKNIYQAKKVVGLVAKKTQKQVMLSLLRSCGKITAQEARTAGVRNPTTAVKGLVKDGHDITKIEGGFRRTGTEEKDRKMIYIYNGPEN